MVKTKPSIPVDSLLHIGMSYRRFRLISLITVETMFFSILLLIFSPSLQNLSTVSLIVIGNILAICNLIALKKYYCLNFSGYFFVSSILLSTFVGNLLIGGPETTFFIWFYITPIIASALLGLAGLTIFGSITIVIVVAYILIQPLPLNDSLDVLSWSVQLINYSFVLLLILTVLTTFLLQNQAHEIQSRSLLRSLETDREKFHYLSKHDLLTDLPNRAYFYAALKTAIKKIKKYEAITVFFMDLEKFKTINDLYGHEAGDQVLIQTSKRLVRCFREHDIVARMGGDEFTALVVHDKNDGTEDVITDRIGKAFQHPFRGDIRQLKCEFSIGFASYPDDAKNIIELMSIADKRMYEEKMKVKKIMA